MRKRHIQPFRYWVQKSIPAVYDDSLSYYELLSKVITYLNEVIENSNNLNDDFIDLQGEFNKLVKQFEILKEYTEEYLTNLDVQEEINNKLDDLVADGTMDTIINHNIFNQLNADLSRKTDKEEVAYWYEPKNIPDCRTDRPNYWFDGFKDDSETAYQKVDEIVSLYGSGASKRLMGKDQSGEYDIWRYSFTPPNFKKTVIIDSAIHGGEVTSFLMTALFLRDMVQRKDEVPILNELYNNVRFVYTPIANPYGFNANNGQATGRLRQNSRQVDLNRNFSYLFDEQGSSSPGDLDYKGEEPFSEKETQYIRDTLQTYNDAIAYFSVHNTGTPDYDVYVPYPQNMNPKGFANLIKEWTKDITSPVINHNESTASGSPNYAYNVEGIIANGIEWSDRKFGSAYSKEDLTMAVKWFGNAVIQHYLLYENQSNVGEISYRNTSDPLTINDTGYWNPLNAIRGLKTSYGDGHAKLTIVGKIKALGNGSIQLNGMLGQAGNGTGLIYTDRQEKWLTELNMTENEEKQFMIVCTIPVKKTTIGGQVVRVGYGLNAYATGASFQLLEYNALLELNYHENELKTIENIVL